MKLLHDVIDSSEVPSMEVDSVYRRGMLDLLANRSSHPTVVQLLASDGGVGHAVTIVGDWIFDATQPRPLQLCRASLDFCCSSAQRSATFVDVEHAVPMRPCTKLHQCSACGKDQVREPLPNMVAPL